MVSRYHERECVSQLSQQPTVAQPFWSCMVRKCCFVVFSDEVLEILLSAWTTDSIDQQLRDFTFTSKTKQQNVGYKYFLSSLFAHGCLVEVLTVFWKQVFVANFLSRASLAHFPSCENIFEILLFGVYAAAIVLRVFVSCVPFRLIPRIF